MPASGFDCYLQDARNNFDAVRPAPIPTDGGVLLGQSQNIHISTNCYYGYHGTKNTANVNVSTDCEMMEVGDAQMTPAPTTQTTAKKRSADCIDCPLSKRLRKEVMAPPTPNFSPCLLRPTHNNPDISRCLMVHMI